MIQLYVIIKRFNQIGLIPLTGSSNINFRVQTKTWSIVYYFYSGYTLAWEWFLLMEHVHLSAVQPDVSQRPLT